MGVFSSGCTFCSYGYESGNNMGNCSISRGVIIWRVLAQVITAISAVSCSVLNTVYIPHISHRPVCGTGVEYNIE